MLAYSDFQVHVLLYYTMHKIKVTYLIKTKYCSVGN